MLLFINLPAKIIGLLESNVSPREIAAGVCLGMYLGFTPLNGPMAALLVLFFFLFKLNRVSTLLTLPLFKAAYLMGLSGLLEKFGSYLLIDASALTGFWSFITGLPLIAYLDINNTVVAGGLTASTVLLVPVYFISKKISAALKNIYAAKVKQSKVAKAVSGLKIVSKVDSALKTDSGISLDVKGIRQMLFGAVKTRILARKGPAKGLRKRLNITGIVIFILVLFAIQFGVGLVISPAVGSLIIDTINHSARTKISAQSVNVWPLTLSFSMKGLKVFDPEKQDVRIIKADDASFRISPLALLSKRLVFSSIRLNGAEVDLEGKSDGSFGIQGLQMSSQVKKAQAAGVGPDLGSMWKIASKNKDLFAKVYSFINDKFSKKGQEKRRLDREVKKSERSVTGLPKGKSVRFRIGKGAYLFEIKKLSINKGYIKVMPYNAAPIEINPARLSLGGLKFDPDNGAMIGSFSIRGDVYRAGNKSGGIDMAFSQTDGAASFDIRLEDIDLDAVRFAYQDSLPVNIIKGNINLSSKTSIKGNAINSNTSLLLTGHRLEPKDGSRIAFGIVPVATIVEALNGIDPVKLKFKISGTVENPEFSGFQESLMSLIKPYISNIKDKVMKEGMNALGKLLERVKENK